MYETQRRRIAEINEAIQNNQSSWHAMYGIRKIQSAECDGRVKRAYLISLKKSQKLSLEERAERIYEFLLSILTEREKLTTENKCLKISAADYEATYCIEAYKDANTVCYIENGVGKTALLYRMGCEKARQRIAVSNDVFLKRINEFSDDYPTPADKYTRFAKALFPPKNK